jgi:hypothetical protein
MGHQMGNHKAGADVGPRPCPESTPLPEAKAS